MDEFRIIEKVGEGTFGAVFKAQHKTTGRIVALKKIRVRRLEEGIPRNLLREVKALQQLQHDNILKIYTFFPQGSSVVIACEFMQADLFHILKTATERCRPVVDAEVKTILLMLLQGGVLKLGDFGLARVHRRESDAQYSHEVATRWYRAPELLFGARVYGNEVDIWSVGCIFAELLMLGPLFPGENDIDQLYRIFRVLGTPRTEDWPGLESLPDFNKITFPEMKGAELSKCIPHASKPALDLLSKLLVFPPHQRLTAQQALMHPYFFVHPLPLHPSRLRSLVTLPKEPLREFFEVTDPTTSMAWRLRQHIQQQRQQQQQQQQT